MLIIHYIRRQALKNAERYIIPKLKEYEEKVLTSKGKALAIKKNLYDEPFDLLLPHLEELQQSTAALDELDVLTNLAERADTLHYACYTMSEQPGLHTTEGLPSGSGIGAKREPFIPNPLSLSPQCHILIIAGPNMGG